MNAAVVAGAGPRPLDTAAEHVAINVPRAAPDSLVGDVRARLIGCAFDSAVDVAVCDDGDRLVGLVSIERLLGSPEETSLRAIMDPNPPVVGPGVDQEVAAWRMVRNGESSLAVVDENGRFRGLIPPNRMLGVLLEEHEEDLARLGGFLTRASQARSASEEAVGRRLWHRLPWLVLGLVGAMAAAGIVASFEEQLRELVLLTFFIPGVVYMADAVGTQTEALIIRGIAVGVPVGRIFVRELVTGAVIGVAIGGVFFPFALLIWDDAGVAATVALALLAGCSVATLVAMGLPYLLHRLGRDPAFGSGPVATVIQDLLSILIYFGIASALV